MLNTNSTQSTTKHKLQQILLDDLAYYTKFREDILSKYKDKDNVDPLVIDEYNKIMKIIEEIKFKLKEL